MKIGSWKLTKLLGEGNFGRIYKGKHRVLGFPVCIKQEKTQKEPYMTMFREEAKMLAKLRHPNCLSLLDYMEPGGDVAQLIVMPFIPGTPLDKDIKQSGPVTDEHLFWITDRILSGLDYLHGCHEIYHSDLKPANAIMYPKRHEVVLVDFGLASLDPTAADRAKGGTPGYIPPEFALGFPPLPASDIYSVGKMMIYMTGGNIDKGECPPDMKPELKDFIYKMIRRDARERPQKVDPLREKLARLRRQLFGRNDCDKPIARRRKR